MIAGTTLADGVTLVLGGARSGKSRFAEGLIEASGRPAFYIATAEAHDGEMRRRIAEHRDRRQDIWTTVDAPLALGAAISQHAREGGAILVDCLTLWVTNLMLAGADIPAASDDLATLLAGPLPCPVVLVSNEVGLGIVPDNAMARAFRDHAGRLHQSIAAVATRVSFVAAGLPLTLKG
ncbi:adenosylcobinamide kinase/adenosylcobinamide phosphate guanyltransferase [Aureimonas sp. SA4125]|uniref:bifunctional adenosylcobinamide kinase/adenosylcobinamide-phosphate guanylyltransferase n=1 Tax=Aureimonas sp. SA4125 TaxID=2826993 RepID=UPI001CC791BE|nr:bifunctional adenosylcobinamide kinase/adenosylcobinamide-phosphate guanylyltransferase [Aureimonas sp. SA4125]BDA82580.1 adenosylcobinamide kinase/adenosylcobinamide phosphate guanyltransferase [Aureimonas sp. SA4125]